MTSNIESIEVSYKSDIEAAAKRDAAAMIELARATDGAIGTIERAPKSAEALSRQYDRQAREVAAVSRATAKLRQDLADLERAEVSVEAKEAQRVTILGQIEAATQRAKAGVERYFKAAEAGAAAATASASGMASGMSAAIASADALRRQYDAGYAAQAKYTDEMRRAEAVMEAAGINGHEYAAILRSVAQAHDPAIKKAAELGAAQESSAQASSRAAMEQAKAVDTLKREIDSGYAAQVRYAQKQQEVIDLHLAGALNGRQFGAAMKFVADSYDPAIIAAKKEADALVELRRAIDPTGERLKSLETQKKALDAAFASGKLSGGKAEYDQLSAAYEKHRNQLVRTTEAANGMAGSLGLTKAQMQALTPQINDVVSGLIMGQPPMMIFTQQSGQIVQALQAGGAEMPKFKASTLLMVGGVGLAAAAIAAIGIKILQVQGQTRDFATMLKATGQQAELTADQVRQASDKIYEAGASREDASSVLNSAISSRKFSGTAQLEEIGKLSVDLGVRFGGTAEAGKKLVGWLTSGVPGLQAMAKETEALSLAQYEAARGALEHGNKAQALQIMIGALKDQFTDLHHDSLGPAEKAMHDFGRAYDDLVTAAANNPITIKIVTTGGEWMSGLADFLKNPSPEMFAKWQLNNPLFGGGLLPTPTGTPQPPPAQKQPPAPITRTSAGTFAGRQASVQGQSGMSSSEARDLSDVVDANDKLLVAMQKTGVARQIAMAQAQAEISALKAGKSAYAAEAEGMEAARMARAQMSTGIADATAQMTVQTRESLKVADAYMVSSAAGERATAMRQAQLDSLQSGVSAEQRYREILEERGAQQAATSALALRTYQDEVAGREAVANATMDGVDAVYKAQMAEKVRVGTLAETIALENSSGEVADRLRKIIEAKTAAILDDDAAQRKQAVGQATQQQRDQLEVGQAQLRLMGASAEQRAVEIARLQAEIYLRNQHVDALSSEGQAYIANSQSLALQQLATERLQAAYQELERFGEQAFSSIIDNVVKGGDSTKTWANAVKGLATEFQTLALRMAVINPIKNAVFGSNLPTVSSFFGNSSTQSSLTGQAANQNSLSTNNLLSLGSRFMPSSWTSGITSAIDTWGANALGIGAASQMPTTVLTGANGMLTGGGATSIIPGEVAAGTGLTSYLGPLGIGAGIGGLLGPMLANGNKAVGGLVGAGSGAAAGALAGNFLFPGVGALVGALLGGGAGGLSGLLGTQKPSVGPYSIGNVDFTSRGAAAGNSAQDNEGDAAAAKGWATAAATTFNAIIQSGGGRLASGLSGGEGGIDYYAKTGKYQSIVGGVEQSFSTLEEAINSFTRRSVALLTERGSLTDLDANVAKALTNTKAKTVEDLLKDVASASSYTQMQKSAAEGYNPFDAQIKAATENAKAFGEELKTTFVDLQTRIVDLGLATQEKVNPMLRTAFEAAIGLGDSYEPLRGIAAVTKQAEIGFAALRPTLEGLGYTAQQQADIQSQLLQKAKDEYNSAVAATTRLGTISVEQAVTPGYRLTAADTLTAAGLKASDFGDLSRSIQGFIDAASTGSVKANDLRGAQSQLNALLTAGRITGEQYAAMISSVTSTYAAGLAASRASMAGWLSVEQAIDPNRKATASDVLRGAGVDVSATFANSGFPAALQSFMDQTAAGAAKANDLRWTFAMLNTELVAGKLTTDQYNTILGTLTQSYSNSSKAAEDAAAAVKTANDNARSSWLSVISSSLSAAQSVASQWSSLYDSLRGKRLSNLLGEYSPLSPLEQLQEAQKQFRDLMAVANDNDPTDAASLKASGQLAAAGDAYLKANRDYWASANPAAFKEVQEGLFAVETVAERQLSLAQKQVDYLSQMADALKALDTTLSDQSKAAGVLSTPRNWGAAAQVPTNLQLALKTGYSGDFGGGGFQSWITQQPDAVKATARDVLTQMGQGWRINGFQNGGVIPLAGAYADGGIVGNGQWGMDSVVARYAGGGAIALAGGEGVLTAPATSAIGSSAVDYINQHHSLPANDRWGGNVAEFRAAARSGGNSQAANNQGVERRLDDLIDLTKAVIYENAGQKAIILKQAAIIDKMRAEAADRDARPRRAGTYAGN